MEKLIELLKEYDNWDYQVYSWRNVWNQIIAKNIPLKYELDTNESEAILISKDYEFIKWLVDNDKIDFYKLDDDIGWYHIKLDDNYLDLLALLSIQDKPIEFLVSILK